MPRRDERATSRLEVPWDPDTKQLPHHETEMEAPHMEEHTLENVRVTSQVSAVSRVTHNSANSRRSTPCQSRGLTLYTSRGALRRWGNFE